MYSVSILNKHVIANKFERTALSHNLNQPERQRINVIVNMLWQQIDRGFYGPHFRQSLLHSLVDEIFASRWR